MFLIKNNCILLHFSYKKNVHIENSETSFYNSKKIQL